jgi:putative methyltransferase (TIGR04325 family)
MIIRDFIPPIFQSMLNKKSLPHNPVSPAVYRTYSNALAACRNLGYEEKDLIDIVFEKTMRFREQLNDQAPISLSDAMLQSICSLFLSIQNQGGGEIRVIDFGGACGAHYFLIKLLLNTTKIKWYVVETPAMVQKARTLETDELYFYDSISKVKKDIGKVDLFHSSGALQYVPDPAGTMREALEVGATYIFLNRLALLPGMQNIITVQESLLSTNGPGAMPAGMKDSICRYPITYVGKEWLENKLQEKYRISMQFGETVVGNIEGRLIITAGIYARKR